MECHGCRKSCSTQRNNKVSSFLKWFRNDQSLPPQDSKKIPAIALVGMPNVGKSVLFNALTSTYVTVSNYPGTTVEVSRGEMGLNGSLVRVIDTPGMYSLLPITEEEKVSRDLLFSDAINLVIHVVDAKNLGRMLPLTFQLIETGLPVLLAINMMDEAKQLGLQIKREHLQMELGVPVVTMAAALNLGLTELRERMWDYVNSNCLSRTY